MTSLWRRAFDTFERPLAAASESWVPSKTFMDLAAVAVRMQRRLAADGQRMTEQWLHAWGMPARGDLFKLMNQVAGLDYIPDAIGALLEDADAKEVTLIGYCFGGILTLLTTAGHPELPIRNMMVLATPCDYREMGFMSNVLTLRRSPVRWLPAWLGRGQWGWWPRSWRDVTLCSSATGST